MSWFSNALNVFRMASYAKVPPRTTPVYFTGLLGVDEAGNLPDVFENEVRRLLQNVYDTWKSAHATPLRMNFFIVATSQTEFNERFDTLNRVWNEFWPAGEGERVARSVVGATFLAKRARIMAVMEGWE